MKAPILALILIIPVSAWSEPCTPTSVGPCTASAEEKYEIMEAIRNAGLEEMAMRDARAKAGAASSEDGRYDAFVSVFSHEKKMKDGLGKAMELTERYYHLTPPQTNGSVVKPKDPLGRGEWSTGLSATWKPEFLYDDKETLRVPGTDGRNHFIGGKIDLNQVGGGTYPSGRVIILIKTFGMAKKAGNPGPLAYMIHHEGGHFRELIGRGWDNYEEGELRTYKASLEAADTFELDATARGELIGKKMKEHSKALRSGKRTSLFPSPEEEMQNELALEAAERERAKFNTDFEALKSRVETARKARRDAEELRKLGEAEAALAAAELQRSQEKTSREEQRKFDEKIRKIREHTYELNWALLRALTLDACNDHTAFRKYYKNRAAPNLRMPEHLLLWKLKNAKDGPSLTPCQQEVIAFVARSDGPVQLEQVADLALKALNLSDPLKAITGFFRSIQEKIRSTPGPSGPGSPGSGRSDPEERRGSGDHGGNAPNGRGPVLGQLKGIAGGGMGIP